MCAIFGALIWSASPSRVLTANLTLDHIMRHSLERGRDGWGYHVKEDRFKSTGYNYKRKSVERGKLWPDHEFFDSMSSMSAASLIGNMRAEPTTEYVKDKREYDQQPYRMSGWNIVHNGTIANDQDLRLAKWHSDSLPTSIDSAAIVERLAGSSTATSSELSESFLSVVQQLEGSYAILATHDDYPDTVFAACNYRPIWFARSDGEVFFASSRDYFPERLVPQMVEPYSVWEFTPMDMRRLDPEPADGERPRALVVCSGGMDSVVAATSVQKLNGFDVELVHFRYGSRAEGPEVAAIHAVANALDVPLHILPLNVYDPEDSPLLRADSEIAGGEAGAEFAHEWVPARNLVMLAFAAAFAEAKGFDYIVLGNNLEEAGAYPDNEPEFIKRFNDLLPHAVGDGKRLKVLMPVGNLMKHEIVSLGEQLGAPMGLTWSCYRSGPLHCGTCGPCFMRQTAYEINGLEDPLQYLNGGANVSCH